MLGPVQITFRDIPSSPAVSALIERRASKLEMLFERIVDCHVVVEEPHRHSRKGKRFHVRIDMHVPGKELVVTRNPEDTKEDLYATLDDAFNDAERVLEEHARQLQRRGDDHVGPPHGTVTTIF